MIVLEDSRVTHRVEFQSQVEISIIHAQSSVLSGCDSGSGTKASLVTQVSKMTQVTIVAEVIQVSQVTQVKQVTQVAEVSIVITCVKSSTNDTVARMTLAIQVHLC